jgi:hypothetical protein
VDRTRKFAAELIKSASLLSRRAEPRPIAQSGNEFSMPVALPTTVSLDTTSQFNLTQAIVERHCLEVFHTIDTAINTASCIAMKPSPIAQEQ